MHQASAGREIVIRTPNDIGVLAEISKTMSDRGIGILACSAWVEGQDGVIHLVTDDNLRAVESLAPKFAAREGSVVVVELPHKPGMLRRVAERLRSEGIDIHHLYASALADQDRCLVVLSTSYNERALLALQ